MEQITIRKAEKNDIPEILELLYELGRPIPQDKTEDAVFEHRIKEYLFDNDKTIILASNGSKIVGMASIMFLSRLNYTKKELYIPELTVKEGFQRKGIGKKLATSCIEIAKQKKCYRIRLESGNQRRESHIFYKKVGFEQTSLSFSKYIS